MFLLIWASLLLSARGLTTEDAVTPQTLNGSRSEAQMKVVTCEWAGEGSSPPPNVTCQLLGNVTVYNSTVVLSCNVHGRADQNLTSPTNESIPEDLLKQLLTTVQQPQVLIAFAIGILLSATVCCLTSACHRKKHRRSHNVADNMDVVTMVDVGEAAGRDDRARYQEAAEGEAEAAGTSAADGDQAPKEVEYSNIVFSVAGKSLAGSKDAREATESEYAEIKNEAAEERRHDGEVLGEDAAEEGEEEGEEGEAGEARETVLNVLAEEGGEDVPLYSQVSK